MNRINLKHALVALLIMLAFQIGCAFLGVANGHWLGAAAAIFFFLGREYTRAEREIAEARGVTVLSLCWYTPLDFRLWSLAVRLDLIFSALACLVSALWIEVFRLLL